MSVSLNGTSQYIEWAGDPVGGGVNEAIFCWMRPRGTALSGNACPLGMGRFGAGSELGILTIGGTAVRAAARDGSASENAQQSRTLSDNWFAVMGVFTSTSDRTIRISGASSVNNTNLNNTLSPGAFDRFRIGVRGYDNSLYFEGDIAEVALWSGTLPDEADFTSLAAGTAPETIKSGSLVLHATLLTAAALGVTTGQTLTSTGSPTTGATHPISRGGGASKTSIILQQLMGA